MKIIKEIFNRIYSFVVFVGIFLPVLASILVVFGIIYTALIVVFGAAPTVTYKDISYKIGKFF